MATMQREFWAASFIAAACLCSSIQSALKATLLATLEGHTGDVMSVAHLPNGRLASGSRDKSVIVWDLATNARLATLQGHEDWVWSVAVLPDNRLASASFDGTIKIWELRDFTCVATLAAGGGVGGSAANKATDDVLSVRALNFGVRGSVVSGGWDKMVRIWDLARGSNLLTLEGHSGPVSSVTALLGGRLVASGSYDKTVRVWGIIW